MVKKYTSDEIKYLVNEILIDVLCVSEVELRPDVKLNTGLGADSLDAIDITMRLQNTFEITIPDEKLAALKTCTVGDIYTMTEQLLTDEKD